MSKPEKKCFIIVFKHRFGIDAWLTFRFEHPSEEEIIEELRENGTWNERDDGDDDDYIATDGSTIDIFGPIKDAVQKVAKESE